MSLRNKIVLILASIAVLYVAADVLVLRFMVSSPFETLEKDEATKDIATVQATIDGMAEDLGRNARAWARRGDVYRYMTEGAPSFEEDVLTEGLLEASDLNLLYLCDPEGFVTWGRIEDSETRETLRVREFPGGQLGTEHPILASLAIKDIDSTHGLMMTERGPMLVASQPILGPRADGGAGASRGTLIMGRFFDASLRERLSELLSVDVGLWGIHSPDLPEREREIIDEITAAPEAYAVPGGEGILSVYDRILDVRDYPGMILRADFNRDISTSGKRIFNYALLSTLATALLILGVLLRLLQGIVIRPLTRLTDHAVEVGQTEDTSSRIAMDRGDEIGLLSREFDGMLDKLAKSREQVVNTARLAGMSEIATGVLHNVGNVLNSVVVSTSLVKRTTEQLAVKDLEAMSSVLTQHQDDLGQFVTDDPQGKQFLPFLSELTREMGVQRSAILQELGSLGKGVEHIQELVRNQQTYAGMSGLFEPADLAEQIDASLSMCKQAYGPLDDLQVVREYEQLPKVPIDKNKTMEILVNLIQNARQVLEDANVEDKRITLRVRDHDATSVRIEVSDNGPGIARENLAKIFNHGFTTRKEGHGFGLHISANAATEMKSRLWAESDGLGQGATFILSIPKKEAPARAA